MSAFTWICSYFCHHYAESSTQIQNVKLVMNLQTCLSVWKKIDCSSLFFLFQVVIKAGQKLTLELFWTIRVRKCVKVSHLNIIPLAYSCADSPAYKLDRKEVVGVSGWHFFPYTSGFYSSRIMKNVILPVSWRK